MQSYAVNPGAAHAPRITPEKARPVASASPVFRRAPDLNDLQANLRRQSHDLPPQLPPYVEAGPLTRATLQQEFMQ